MTHSKTLPPLASEVLRLIKENPQGLRTIDLENLLGLPRSDRELQRALNLLRHRELIKRRTCDTLNRTIYVATWKTREGYSKRRGRCRGRLHAFHEHQPTADRYPLLR